ncbi:zinc transporter ZntB [Marinicauda salina]|uniref:Zinc transporter ZntB n=1 Tax=Marinicauda salina TaxID=2135793 RepID=A0A2U2BSG3_9PROT|nr:zinc transporter ZntB [Marinicauda salina]PWE16953.1 zinc transporter ZntB [Marinicauda salina]
MAAPLLDPVSVFRLDGRGAAETLEADHLFLPEHREPKPAAEGPGDAFMWAHLNRDERTALNWLKEHSGLDGYVQQALLADDTRPRCTVHGDGAVVILRGVNLHEGAEPEDMISVRFWIEADRVIGVWLRPLYAIADIIDAIERGVAPVTPGDLIAKLALRLIDRMEPTVAELHEEIDHLEEQLLDERDGAAFHGELADIRRRAILLRRFIGPQRDALTTLAIEDLSWLSERDRSRLREAGDRTTRLLEELEAARERAAVVHDQLLEKRAEQMNRYTLVLSVVAAIFLPLSLLTGLLGINVAGIPGAETPWAFAAVTALIVFLGAVEVWLFRRLKLI